MKHSRDCTWMEPLRCGCGLIQRIKYAPAEADKEMRRLRAENERLQNEVAVPVIKALGETIAELRAEVESLRQDAERYRWLKSRKGLTLRSDFSIWYKTDGRQFINTHYLAEGNTQHGPGESLDEIIDKAMALRKET